MDRAKLAAQLTVDEGRKKRIYRDTADPPRWTGGVGRNLTDRDFSDDEIDLMLKNDIDKVERELDHALPWWRTLNEARQNALANMCFQLGLAGLLAFKNTLALLQAGRWDAAAAAALDSKWQKQVPARAKRVTDMIRTGEF
jgi:lysozyme